MAKYEVVYKSGVRGSTTEDDCYYGESFRGTVTERSVIDATDQDDANRKAELLACEEHGEVVSVVKVC